MLTIRDQPKSTSLFSRLLGLFALTLVAGGLYILSLVSAPIIMPLVSKPLDPTALASPQPNDNRIIIPKIGVDIPYQPGESALNTGAWWRHPDRGNPSEGGNFILAAHRFEIQPTPQATWEKSPFYHIDKLEVGDEIIIDYQGKRYGYKIDSISNVKPTQVEIEAPSDTAKLTLYSCGLGGAKVDRHAITAQPMGEVVIKS